MKIIAHNKKHIKSRSIFRFLRCLPNIGQKRQQCYLLATLGQQTLQVYHFTLIAYTQTCRRTFSVFTPLDLNNFNVQLVLAFFYWVDHDVHMWMSVSAWEHIFRPANSWRRPELYARQKDGMRNNRQAYTDIQAGTQTSGHENSNLARISSAAGYKPRVPSLTPSNDASQANRFAGLAAMPYIHLQIAADEIRSMYPTVQ